MSDPKPIKNALYAMQTKEMRYKKLVEYGTKCVPCEQYTAAYWSSVGDSIEATQKHPDQWHGQIFAAALNLAIAKGHAACNPNTNSKNENMKKQTQEHDPNQNPYGFICRPESRHKNILFYATMYNPCPAYHAAFINELVKYMSQNSHVEEWPRQEYEYVLRRCIVAGFEACEMSEFDFAQFGKFYGLNVDFHR